MTKNPPASYEKLIRDLAKILNETHLTEIEYEADGNRVRISRQGTVAAAYQPVAVAPAASAEPAPVEKAKPAAAAANHVKSPMVGTAYLSPAPGEKVFISVGARVKTGETLLIIEAMKVMNPIRSPQDGVIKAILINNAEPVEFDQPLVTFE